MIFKFWSLKLVIGFGTSLSLDPLHTTQVLLIEHLLNPCEPGVPLKGFLMEPIKEPLSQGQFQVGSYQVGTLKGGLIDLI